MKAAVFSVTSVCLSQNSPRLILLDNHYGDGRENLKSREEA